VFRLVYKDVSGRTIVQSFRPITFSLRFRILDMNVDDLAELKLQGAGGQGADEGLASQLNDKAGGGSVGD
jgi:hypothetical protein